MSRLQIPGNFAPQPQALAVSAPFNDMQTIAMMMAVMDTDPNRSVADLYSRAESLLLEAFKRRNEFQVRGLAVLKGEATDVEAD
jgi:hypothetical protein